LEGIKYLIVLHAGLMTGVPVEALTDRFTVSYAPSATVSTRLRQRPAHSDSPRILAVGDPVLPPRQAPPNEPLPLNASPQPGNHSAPLPGSRREAAALTWLFPQSDILLGSDAGELRLEQMVKDGGLKPYRVLHFATHTEIDPANLRRCALILSQDKAQRRKLA